MLRKPRKGSRMISAVNQARVMDGAELALRHELGRSLPVQTGFGGGDYVKVRNDSAQALTVGEAIELDEHIGGADIHRKNLVFSGIIPTGSGVPFGILLEALPVDKIGWAQVSGACVAEVNVTDAGHRFAATNASKILQSAGSGPCEILWKPAGTGQAECLVRFGGEGAEAGRKLVDFELDEELTTSMASADATIVTEYGPGTEASSSSITVLNPMGQAFFGEAGARGLAMWDHDSTYIIIQLAQECLPDAPAQYTLSVEDIETDWCIGDIMANNYGEPMTLERVGPYTWRHDYSGDNHVGEFSNNRVYHIPPEETSGFCEVTTEAHWELRMAPNGTITVDYYIRGVDSWYDQWERYTWQLTGSGSRVFNQSNTSIPVQGRVSGQEGMAAGDTTRYALDNASSTVLVTAVP